MRWVTPASGGRSSRAPTPTKTPTATDRTDSIFSEMTRRPSGRVVCWCTGLSLRQHRSPRVKSRSARDDEAVRHRDGEGLDDCRVELRSGVPAELRERRVDGIALR